MNTENLNKKLLEIFKVLSINSFLNYYDGGVKINTSGINLLSIDKESLITPYPNLISNILQHKSNLKNYFRNIKDLTTLIQTLTHNDDILRLNHVGFCYKVLSINEEKQRLVKAASERKLHLYQEESSDEGSWFFMGNISHDWQSPIIEYILIEQTNDEWQQYWLPHVQIDIDTKLTANKIVLELKKAFGSDVQPYAIIIGGVTYIIRLWLGTVDGINIQLDFSTDLRMTQIHRTKFLKLIV